MAPVFPCYASENSLLRSRREFASKPLVAATRFSATEVPIGPNFAKFPVIFPVSREFPARDGFARDWLLSQPVSLAPSPCRRLRKTPHLPPFPARKRSRRRQPQADSVRPNT